MVIIRRERAQVLNELLRYRMDESERYYLRTAQDIYAELANSAEMHYFVSNFSWENDHTILRFIANDKRCDKATALMIFWRACPRFYTKFASEEEAKIAYVHVILALLKDVLSNWENDFYTHQQLAFDLHSVSSYEINTPEPNEKWSIPDSIKISLPGEIVIAEQ